MVAEKNRLTNYTKTFIFTIIVTLFAVVLTAMVQLNGQNGLFPNASYLDPIYIDVAAFAAAFFFIIEGTWRISEHKNASWKRQFTRSLRIAFGFGILTVHIIQLFYKFF